MAERTRLAAAGFFLAMTLAVVPALIPVRFAGASVTQSTETIRPVVHLRGGPLTTRAPSEPELLADGVVEAAISQAMPRSYSVAQGDTLWKISRDAGVSVEALAAANHLMVGTQLHPGQTLIMPAPDAPAPATASAAMPRPAEPGIAATRLRVGVAFRSLAAGVWSLGRPSEGLITSRFGWRTHPIFGTREFHTGLDIANRTGTPIRAAETGIVRFVGWMGGYGRLIVVAHPNGFETSYSHLSAMLVGLGQRVGRGDVLGLMGSTGWSTGPHLFFEVRQHGVPVDPLPYLQAYRSLPGRSDPEIGSVKPAGGPSVHPPARPAASRPRSPAAPPASSPVVSAVPLGSSHAKSEAPSAKDGSTPASKEHRAVTDGGGETQPAVSRQATDPY